jgi:hypothetical protein
LRTKLVFSLWVVIILACGVLTGVRVWPYKGHLTGISVNSAVAASKTSTTGKFTNSFDLGNCTFSSTGNNRYFILKPGYQSVFTGVDEGKDVKLTITVLNKTNMVNGTETRIVEEKAVNNKTGELYEVSRNYFAICKENNSVFYFGEDVDWYKDGNVANHTGTWHHGVNNAKAGLIMPGIALIGSRYYQETAPDVAIDRGEIVSISETVKTPAGTFVNCLQEQNSDPLDPGDTAFKYYAPGVGLVRDDMLNLVSYSHGSN